MGQTGESATAFWSSPRCVTVCPLAQSMGDGTDDDDVQGRESRPSAASDRRPTDGRRETWPEVTMEDPRQAHPMPQAVPTPQAEVARPAELAREAPAQNSIAEPSPFIAAVNHLRHWHPELSDEWIALFATIHETVVNAGHPSLSVDYIFEQLTEDVRQLYLEYLAVELPEDIRRSYVQRFPHKVVDDADRNDGDVTTLSDLLVEEASFTMHPYLTGDRIEYFNDDHTIRLQLFPCLEKEAGPAGWALIEALSIGYANVMSGEFADERDSVLEYVRDIQGWLDAYAWDGLLAQESTHAKEVLAHIVAELAKLEEEAGATDWSSSSDDDDATS